MKSFLSYLNQFYFFCFVIITITSCETEGWEYIETFDDYYDVFNYELELNGRSIYLSDSSATPTEKRIILQEAINYATENQLVASITDNIVIDENPIILKSNTYVDFQSGVALIGKNCLLTNEAALNIHQANDDNIIISNGTFISTDTVGDFSVVKFKNLDNSIIRNSKFTGSKDSNYNTEDANLCIINANDILIENCKSFGAEKEGLLISLSSNIIIESGEYFDNGYSGIGTRDGDKITLRSCHVHENGTSNISINSNHSEVLNCLIQVNNPIHPIISDRKEVHGINLGHNTENSTVKSANNCIIKDNTIIGSVGAGIFVFVGNNILIDGNKIFDAGQGWEGSFSKYAAGISFHKDVVDIEVSNNTVKNSLYGIKSVGTSHLTIQNNLLSKNRRAGIYLQRIAFDDINISPKFCTLTDNTIISNGIDSNSGDLWWLDCGMAIDFYCQNLIIKNNLFTDNNDQISKSQNYGIVIRGTSEQNILDESIIIGNFWKNNKIQGLWVSENNLNVRNYFFANNDLINNIE